MPQKYLKCKYFENPPMIVFPHEYLVTFKCQERCNPKVLLGNHVFPPEGEEWCIVNREEVLCLDGVKGLVKLVKLIIDENESDACAYINDTGDRRISGYKVPLEEIELK